MFETHSHVFQRSRPFIPSLFYLTYHGAFHTSGHQIKFLTLEGKCFGTLCKNFSSIAGITINLAQLLSAPIYFRFTQIAEQIPRRFYKEFLS